MKKLIHNVDTGEIIEQDISVDELAQMQSDAFQAEGIKLAAEQDKAKKIALLEKLGITEEEAKLLLS